MAAEKEFSPAKVYAHLAAGSCDERLESGSEISAQRSKIMGAGQTAACLMPSV